MSNGNGASAPDMSSWGWIADTVRTAVLTMHDASIMKQQAQRNPCDMGAMLREILGGGPLIVDKIENYGAIVNAAAQFLPDIIAESLSFKGRHPPGSDLSGGKRLAEYALDSLGPTRLLPPGVMAAHAFLGPGLGWLASIDWVEARMPTGNELVNGDWRQAVRGGTGEYISPGVYLSPGGAGTASVYKGNRIGRLISQWIRYQVQNVTTSDLGTARRNLTTYVGSYRGTGPFGIWQNGDPIVSPSKLWQVLENRRHILEIEEYARLLCAEQQAASGELMAEIMTTGIELSAEAQEAAILADRQAAIARARRGDWLVVGGLVIGALVAVRS